MVGAARPGIRKFAHRQAGPERVGLRQRIIFVAVSTRSPFGLLARLAVAFLTQSQRSLLGWFRYFPRGPGDQLEGRIHRYGDLDLRSIGPGELAFHHPNRLDCGLFGLFIRRIRSIGHEEWIGETVVEFHWKCQVISGDE